ncbi:hypothetical protein [Wenyingzhuangia sp. IMCC45467]
MKTSKVKIFILLILIALGFYHYMSAQEISDKIIPEKIKDEANIALSHYPGLEKTAIEFVIKPSLKTSFMKAQPVFSTILNPTKSRKYKIYISHNFMVENKKVSLDEIPKNVLIGWLGHELGHIMDYKNRSGLNLVFFGFRYLFSGKHIREAERVADSYAVSNGMGAYILATKNYILNHADFSEVYKNRIKRLYVSPDEILELIAETDSINNLKK